MSITFNEIRNAKPLFFSSFVFFNSKLHGSYPLTSEDGNRAAFVYSNRMDGGEREYNIKVYNKQDNTLLDLRHSLGDYGIHNPFRTVGEARAFMKANFK